MQRCFSVRIMSTFRTLKFKAAALVILVLASSGYVSAQKPQAAKVELGSQTAKNGFKNETEIQEKFNNWKTDEDARVWLAAMNYKVAEIESVAATKPHGEKADVEVKIKTAKGARFEGARSLIVTAKATVSLLNLIISGRSKSRSSIGCVPVLAISMVVVVT